MDRRARIETRLREAFAPLALDVLDESHRHRGHAGAAGGAGHFRVRLVSERFRGVARVERHRLVYDALAAEIGPEIHALALELRSPDEPAPP
ncbi:MAG TPA: BolA family transcriptional regulator [Myxococcota bacterium]|nr:BolA family transcriptional regulator [Myxococcota bacterium]